MTGTYIQNSTLPSTARGVAPTRKRSSECQVSLVLQFPGCQQSSLFLQPHRQNPLLGWFAVMADLAKRRMRAKIPVLTEALIGRFSDHHRFMVRLFLDRIDAHSADIDRLTERIEAALVPFRLVRELLIAIPGFSTGVADVFIAETGADMSAFPTAAQLASWAGTVPGSNESAIRIKSTKTRPGDSYLKGALGVAALAVSKTKNTYFSAKYKRIVVRRGKMKALVAIEHAMLIAAWNMLTTGELYCDPGVDYFIRRAPDKAKACAISQLEALGYQVRIPPVNDVHETSLPATSPRPITSFSYQASTPSREHY